MSLTFRLSPTEFSSTTTGVSSYTFTGAINCTSGDPIYILCAAVLDGGTVKQITGATIGGVAATKIFSTDAEGDLTHLNAFKLESHTLSGAKDLVISFAEANAYGCVGFFCSFVPGTGVIAVDKTATSGTTASGEDQSVVLTGAAANAALLAIRCTQFNNAEGVSTNLTLLDISNAYNTNTAGYSVDAGAAGDKTVSFTGGDLLYGVIAISVAEGAPPGTIEMTGEDSAAVYGTHTISSAVSGQTVSPSGTASGAAFGSLMVSSATTKQVQPTGLATSAVYGSVRIISPSPTISPAGLASASKYGLVNLVQDISQGVPSAARYGTATLTTAGGGKTIAMTGVASAAVYGTIRFILQLRPTQGRVNWQGLQPSLITVPVMSPAPASVSIAGLAPLSFQLRPQTAAPTISGLTPTLVALLRPSPQPAALTAAGLAVALTYQMPRTPTSGLLTITGYAPSFTSPAPPVVGFQALPNEYLQPSAGFAFRTVDMREVVSITPMGVATTSQAHELTNGAMVRLWGVSDSTASGSFSISVVNTTSFTLLGLSLSATASGGYVSYGDSILEGLSPAAADGDVILYTLQTQSSSFSVDMRADGGFGYEAASATSRQHIQVALYDDSARNWHGGAYALTDIWVNNAQPTVTVTGDGGVLFFNNGDPASATLDIFFADADGDSLSYVIQGGTLPPGMTLSAGVVMGTPTTRTFAPVTIRGYDLAGEYAHVDVMVVVYPIDVPDVTGLEEGAAQALLEDRFLFTTTELAFDSSISFGNVIETSPAAGTQVSPSSTVVMTLSVGDALRPAQAAWSVTGLKPSVAPPGGPAPTLLTIAGLAPTFAIPIVPLQGLVSVTGYAPSFIKTSVTAPGPASLSVAGLAPSLTFLYAPGTLVPPPAQLIMASTGYYIGTEGNPKFKLHFKWHPTEDTGSVSWS